MTSHDLEENRHKVDFKATWTIDEEIQTEERNHARFSMWYGACNHVACPSSFKLHRVEFRVPVSSYSILYSMKHSWNN